MAFMYSTEYTLGRRGRIRRTYSGVQALIAIAFDLTLGLTFGLIGPGLWLVRSSVVTAYRLFVNLFRMPLQAVRSLSGVYPSRRVAKPAWASFDEL